MVNTELILNIDKFFDDEEEGENPNQVYVIAAFHKPGRQLYAVSLTEDGETSYYLHKAVVPPRQEDVPHFAKATKQHKLVRKFNRKNSVFNEWVHDDDQLALECIEQDMRWWNIPRLIKDKQERDELKVIVREHATLLKNMFIQLASKSAFPQIGWQDFTNFSNKVHLPDATVSSGIIDMLYKAANNGSLNVKLM